MSNEAARRVLRQVIKSIARIDRDCKTLLNEVELGLVGVKLQHAEAALNETGKKLTEETLVAWLVQKDLATEWSVEREVPYPMFPRKKCDLVVELGPADRLWLELKFAWKAWFNCVGEPNWSNGNYFPYLEGSSKTHSFRHDLEKLACDGWPAGDHRAVCLIGTDSQKSPMVDEVLDVVARTQVNGAWNLIAEERWNDRRCKDFRYHVWCWLLTGHPATCLAASEQDGAAVMHGQIPQEGRPMAEAKIVDLGDGPKIAGTRITVYDILHYLEAGWRRDAIAAHYRLSSGQVAAAQAHIAAHGSEVRAAYAEILERNRQGNPPHIEAKVAAGRERFRAFVAAKYGIRLGDAAPEAAHAVHPG